MVLVVFPSADPSCCALLGMVRAGVNDKGPKMPWTLRSLAASTSRGRPAALVDPVRYLTEPHRAGVVGGASGPVHGMVDRIARIAFETARKRHGKLCSVDKANVLEASIFWRRRVTMIAAEFPDVELSHMYVDNASMQLIRDPKQDLYIKSSNSEFDTILTNNIFGDILSDEASMLTGSIGMLPSASLAASGPGLFEPIHGSAPDIAGQVVSTLMLFLEYVETDFIVRFDCVITKILCYTKTLQDKANPLATVLSAAMLLRYGLGEENAARRIENAVLEALDKGFRTGDIFSTGTTLVGCKKMGEEVLKSVDSQKP
ncbi:hypothetical protein Taro_000541, partial [Colocasia esculenta]|nr:hypothetical protein [Colocasia esculenta]